METTEKDKSQATLPTEARDKSVKIRIVSRKGKTREETRRDLMEMSEEQLNDLFENYDFLDPLGHTLTRSVVFQELLKIAVEGRLPNRRGVSSKLKRPNMRPRSGGANGNNKTPNFND